MLDWWSGQVASDASRLDTGTFECWGKGRSLEYSFPRRANVEGSYRQTIHVSRAEPHLDLARYAARQPPDYHLPSIVYSLSGNPSKFLQGHNCFGPPVSQADQVIMDVMENLSPDYKPDIIQGGLHPTRIDATIMIDMGSHNLVHDWLEHAGKHTRSRHGRPQTEGSTVMWGSKTRWEIVAYCKACEFRVHPPSLLDFRSLALQYLQPMLRLELRISAKELVKLAKEQTPVTEALVWEYFERVEIGIMKTDGIPAIDHLPHVSRLIARSWLNGDPVRNEMKKTQFYCHRRCILDQTGLDISLDPEGVLDSYPRINLDREYLKAREVHQIPEVLNKWLWKPREATDQKIAVN
jgi:Phage replication protein CRI